MIFLGRKSAEDSMDKRKDIKLGGHASYKGVTFVADNYTASFTMGSDNQYTITTKKRSRAKGIKKIIKKIPLIRGIWTLLGSNSIIFFVFTATLLYDAFMWLGPKYSTVSVAAYIIYLTISLIALVYIFLTLFRSTKNAWAFHGAEHKTIYAYLEGVKLDLESVRGCPCEARRCGTNLVIFGFFFLIIFQFFISFNSVRILLAFAVAYEFFSLKNGDKIPVIKLFFKVGYWLQRKLLTREPSDIQLIASIETMKKLIALEESVE